MPFKFFGFFLVTCTSRNRYHRLNKQSTLKQEQSTIFSSECLCMVASRWIIHTDDEIIDNTSRQYVISRCLLTITWSNFSIIILSSHLKVSMINADNFISCKARTVAIYCRKILYLNSSISVLNMPAWTDCRSIPPYWNFKTSKSPLPVIENKRLIAFDWGSEIGFVDEIWTLKKLQSEIKSSKLDVVR